MSVNTCNVTNQCYINFVSKDDESFVYLGLITFVLVVIGSGKRLLRVVIDLLLLIIIHTIDKPYKILSNNLPNCYYTYWYSFNLQGQTALDLVEHCLTSHSSRKRSKGEYELEEEHIAIRSILMQVHAEGMFMMV